MPAKAMSTQRLKRGMRSSIRKRSVSHVSLVTHKPLPQAASQIALNRRAPPYVQNTREGTTVAQVAILEAAMDMTMGDTNAENERDDEPTILASQVSLDDAEHVAFDIPESYAEKVKWVSSQMTTTFKLALVRFIKPDQEIEPKLEVKLVLFLRALNVIEFTKTLDVASKLQYTFKYLLDNRDGKFRAFPEKYIEQVRALMEKWKEQGFAPEEEVSEEEEATQPSSSSSTVKKSIKVSETGDAPVIRRPSSNHPIYGKTGIMRGILVGRGASRSYRLDDEWPKVKADVFGANNLHVGDWWPLQIAALRDGAHGARMGGISGDRGQGAYSIVVSRTYGTLDEDQGDILYYSGSQSHENTSDVPTETRATKCLLASVNTKLPVRVLRAASGHSFAPAVGIRYDGLYRVVSKVIARNDKGGAYYKFQLVRRAGQPPIDTSRPTRQEMKLHGQVALGY